MQQFEKKNLLTSEVLHNIKEEVDCLIHINYQSLTNTKNRIIRVPIGSPRPKGAPFLMK
jgi:hypothetical protein